MWRPWSAVALPAAPHSNRAWLPASCAGGLSTSEDNADGEVDNAAALAGCNHLAWRRRWCIGRRRVTGERVAIDDTAEHECAVAGFDDDAPRDPYATRGACRDERADVGAIAIEPARRASCGDVG